MLGLTWRDLGYFAVLLVTTGVGLFMPTPGSVRITLVVMVACMVVEYNIAGTSMAIWLYPKMVLFAFLLWLVTGWYGEWLGYKWATVAESGGMAPFRGIGPMGSVVQVASMSAFVLLVGLGWGPGMAFLTSS